MGKTEFSTHTPKPSGLLHLGLEYKERHLIILLFLIIFMWLNICLCIDESTILWGGGDNGFHGTGISDP